MHAEQPFKWIQSYLCKNWHIRLVIIFKKFSSEASWLQQPSSSYLRWWILSVTVIFYSILPIRNWKSLFRRRAGDELCSQSSAHAEDFICLMGARFFVNPTIFMLRSVHRSFSNEILLAARLHESKIVFLTLHLKNKNPFLHTSYLLIQMFLRQRSTPT